MKFNQNAKGERGPESPNRPRSDRQIRPRFADNSKCQVISKNALYSSHFCFMQKQSLFAVYGAQYNAAGTNVDVQMGGTTSIIVNNDGGGRPAVSSALKTSPALVVISAESLNRSTRHSNRARCRCESCFMTLAVCSFVLFSFTT